MYFALACEGVTDFAVVEAVLCGFFDEDITDEITYLQPHLDETSKSQKGFGGWEQLLDYLQSTRFYEDVKFNDYIIIQIDTDVLGHLNFGVPHYDENNKELAVLVLIEKVIAKLVELINKNHLSFYESHKEKIIFCICVHSIECWLLAHYKSMKKPKTKNCFKALAYELKKNEDSLKNYKIYQGIAAPLANKKTLEGIRLKDASLHLFLERLSQVAAPNSG
ncbi:MAG: hypothetical protein RI964_1222 [Pseudomonadota bacterium]|jgi:hypothetical protein